MQSSYPECQMGGWSHHGPGFGRAPGLTLNEVTCSLRSGHSVALWQPEIRQHCQWHMLDTRQESTGEPETIGSLGYNLPTEQAHAAALRTQSQPA